VVCQTVVPLSAPLWQNPSAVGVSLNAATILLVGNPDFWKVADTAEGHRVFVLIKESMVVPSR